MPRRRHAPGSIYTDDATLDTTMPNRALRVEGATAIATQYGRCDTALLAQVAESVR